MCRNVLRRPPFNRVEDSLWLTHGTSSMARRLREHNGSWAVLRISRRMLSTLLQILQELSQKSDLARRRSCATNLRKSHSTTWFDLQGNDLGEAALGQADFGIHRQVCGSVVWVLSCVHRRRELHHARTHPGPGFAGTYLVGLYSAYRLTRAGEDWLQATLAPRADQFCTNHENRALSRQTLPHQINTDNASANTIIAPSHGVPSHCLTQCLLFFPNRSTSPKSVLCSDGFSTFHSVRVFSSVHSCGTKGCL
jgi:hypothetical protein